MSRVASVLLALPRLGAYIVLRAAVGILDVAERLRTWRHAHAKRAGDMGDQISDGFADGISDKTDCYRVRGPRRKA